MVVGTEQTRILIVSASHYTRYIISGELSSEPDLFVVGTARTPDEISYKREMLRPDLIVVDIESSRDLSDLQQNMPEMHLPVLALCAHTEDGAELAFAALEVGAADIIAKRNSKSGGADFAPDLLTKVRGLAHIKPHRAAWEWPSNSPRTKMSPRRFFPGDRLVVVSASTGGLIPLTRLLSALPSDLSASLLVLPALPMYYMYLFMRRISPATAFCLRQARDGLPINSGVAYFAPANHHLTTGARGRLVLDRSPRRNNLRSSIDGTMSSLACQYGPAVIGVVLSGIGRDGVQGILDICAAGGSAIVQEMESCIADETPAAVIESGAEPLVLPPDEIAEEIARQVTASS